MATHYVVFYTATAGINGPLLGSDEEDIIILHYLVLEATSCKVATEQHYILRPAKADENENFLSEQAREDYCLTEDLVKNGQTLRSAIESFHAVLSGMCGCPPGTTDWSHIALITDGQLHLRQVLHPKALAAGMVLPEYYNSFIDLRKEFREFYHNQEIQTVKDMVDILGQTPEETGDLATKSVRDMSRIIGITLQRGHRLLLQEVISTRLEPGICTKGEEVDNNCVVRARGLPWQSSDQDIAKFFRGLNISKGGVALCLSQQGKRNGEALVRFLSPEHRDMALRRHKHHIGNRYIEVYKATGEDFINVAGDDCVVRRRMSAQENSGNSPSRAGDSTLIVPTSLPPIGPETMSMNIHLNMQYAAMQQTVRMMNIIRNNNEAQQFLSRGGQVIIRMRGLPYECTAQQVVEFFESGENGCQILDGEDGVLFVRKPDGKATGDAFVLFSSEEDGAKALAKHKQVIGSRYIELFRSTTAEVQQVLNRSMDPRTYEQQPPLISTLPPVTLIPPQVVNPGARKDCIRLRGLPYEAQVEHILEFLGEHAEKIILHGVHMVYNAQGQLSGEAFVQMKSDHSAYMAAQQRHNTFMVCGKKQRYIEVFQCSSEEMNLGLAMSGGLPTQRPILSPAGGTLVAAPYGPYPLGPAPPIINVGAMTPRLAPYPGMAYPAFFYWPYPSPPVSPGSAYLHPAPHLASPASSHTMIAAECIQVHPPGEMSPLQPNCEPVPTM